MPALLPFQKTLFILLLLTAGILSFAQEICKGKIQSETGEPLAGAIVAVKGKPNVKTKTNADGSFAIPAGPGDILQITSIGYEATETGAGNASAVFLKTDAKNLNEVVVTALGIRKEIKKLGYAVQEVKGADLVKAREPNAVNSLKGKVAGLNVNISAELLRAPNINFRGNGNILFVVDGVPIKSDTWNISPDNIESYTFVKGQTAGSQYGALAQNGAIIINTKKEQKTGVAFLLSITPAPCLKTASFPSPATRMNTAPAHRVNMPLRTGLAAA